MMRTYLLSSIFRAPEGAGAGGAGADPGAAGGAGGGGAAAGGGAGGAAAGGTGGAAGGAGASAGAGPGASGGQAEPWYAPFKLDKDLVEHIEGKKFADIGTALRSGFEADKVARSRNVIEKPDPKGDIKSWNGWETLGWQKDGAKYGAEIAPPDPKSLNFTYDGEMWDSFKKLAHENRIPVAQAKAMHDGLLKFWGERVDRLTQDGSKKLQDANAALDAKWGDKAQANRERARRAATTLGVTAEQFAAIEKVSDGASTVELFNKIGELMGEERLQTGGGAGGGALGGMSSTSLKAERGRLEATDDFKAALNDPKHPRRAELMARRDELIEAEAAARDREGGRRAA